MYHKMRLCIVDYYMLNMKCNTYVENLSAYGWTLSFIKHIKKFSNKSFASAIERLCNLYCLRLLFVKWRLKEERWFSNPLFPRNWRSEMPSTRNLKKSSNTPFITQRSASSSTFASWLTTAEETFMEKKLQETKIGTERMNTSFWMKNWKVKLIESFGFRQLWRMLQTSKSNKLVHQ